MRSIYDITDWSHMASFFAWTLAVCALAKAIFGSLLAAGLQYWLAMRDTPRRQRMRQLGWEITHRRKWDENVARGSQHATAVPLTDAELDARRIELHHLARTSLPRRALQYLLNCWACQTFWTAVLIYAVTVGVTAPAAWLFSAAAYSGAAVVLSVSLNVSALVPAGAGLSKTGCKNCGR